MKRCTKCGELKPETEFYAAKGCKDGLRGDCKACFAARARDWYARNREHVVANVKRWQSENPEQVRATRRKRNAIRRREIREEHLRRTFGMMQAEYEVMLVSQCGGCAICGRKPKGRSLHVDHDHATGQIRGLLCFKCNGGLGQFADDPNRLATAIGYLAKGDQLTEVIAARAHALRVA